MGQQQNRPFYVSDTLVGSLASQLVVAYYFMVFSVVNDVSFEESSDSFHLK